MRLVEYKGYPSALRLAAFQQRYESVSVDGVSFRDRHRHLEFGGEFLQLSAPKPLEPWQRLGRDDDTGGRQLLREAVKKPGMLFARAKTRVAVQSMETAAEPNKRAIGS